MSEAAPKPKATDEDRAKFVEWWGGPIPEFRIPNESPDFWAWCAWCAALGLRAY